MYKEMMSANLEFSPSKEKAFDYAVVEEDEAAEIFKFTGYEVDGYSHSVARQDLRHIFNGHGPGNEKSPQQRPVTEADVAKIPELIKGYDEMVPIIMRNGTPGIRYSKRGNGKIFYVESVFRGRKRLAAASMWIIV
ncbi:MAG: hypothetical protein M3Y56_12300 [Armatimonadota bacterium]|nr:hypothetical protein [Armatimonadota bacterium]